MCSCITRDAPSILLLGVLSVFWPYDVCMLLSPRASFRPRYCQIPEVACCAYRGPTYPGRGSLRAKGLTSTALICIRYR